MMLTAMPPPPAASSARADVLASGGALTIEVGGQWRITADRPAWPSRDLPRSIAGPVRVVARDLQSWDSSLVLYLRRVQTWCEERKLTCETTALPAGVRDLLERVQKGPADQVLEGRPSGGLTRIGLRATRVWWHVTELVQFVGECVIAIVRLARQPAKFRFRDCLYEMQQCGAMALPIAGLIAFLVGVTLAYTGAIILRQFGADIWVADLIGLSMTREMGAVMTGIVLAGRTGAAFAAELGNMKAGEEIDALVTLGIRPVDFLVIPRMVALVVMMPLLTLYANALGIIGGMVIAQTLLDIPPRAYWIEMLTIVDTSDLMTGLIKAVTFGAMVAVSGCLRGLQADRSAAGVGRAATSSVVTSILLIVIADALFAVIFNILGW